MSPILAVAATLVLLGAWSPTAFAQEKTSGPELHGRVHIDYAFHQDDQTEFGDGHRLRRARISAEGRIDENWSYQSEIDFAENEPEFKDVWLRYHGFEAGTVTQGQFKIPFGMDELTSSNNITFVERALPMAFGDANDVRRMGLGFNRAGGGYTVTAMLFGQPIGTNASREPQKDEDTGEEVPGGKEGFGIGGRFTFNPIKNESGLVHLGIAYATEGPPSDQDKTARIRQRPESRTSGIRLVDTGTIEEVDTISRAGIELAWQGGPMIVQAEYITAMIAAAEDYTFDGYYAQASYVVTGEMKGYRNGVFTAPTPRESGTAIEVAARYSHINLNDGDVEGGEETNTSLGLNFYPVKGIRFMLNYILVDSERQGVSDAPSILLFRTQVSF
jgi:phosphate-selective porin OprO/OprP